MKLGKWSVLLALAAFLIFSGCSSGNGNGNDTGTIEQDGVQTDAGLNGGTDADGSGLDGAGGAESTPESSVDGAVDGTSPEASADASSPAADAGAEASGSPAAATE
ncbi:MAG: hypothetical protein C6P35_14660 [Cohnella sp.]|uniref:hypothetical protein n=1 Tax=Cohnella sp. TaxID=1883426 RepID=UPI000E3663D2|nr:hypothetical protein [Cohnella sp.]REK63206.1 MAG: hypothetical protein C6P35_14660 [Cohnella sp.]